MSRLNDTDSASFPEAAIPNDAIASNAEANPEVKRGLRAMGNDRIRTTGLSCSAVAYFLYVLPMMRQTFDSLIDGTFFAQGLDVGALVGLFDYLPGVIFYAKDRESRYVAANRAMLMAKELEDPRDLLGKTDRDFHPSVLADAYIAEDQRILEIGEPLPNQVWFIIDRSGKPGWFQSTKIPLRNGEGEVLGIAGVRYSIETPEDRKRQFRRLAPVIRHLEEHYTETVSMSEMAALAGMSSTHFNREFHAIFRMSPTRFLHALRIEKARQLLTGTDDPIGEIALVTGYHDQSHFSRNFQRVVKMTPRAFRKRFR
jgi:AraC-like DNA-binding protein